jgi:hypothetical protein
MSEAKLQKKEGKALELKTKLSYKRYKERAETRANTGVYAQTLYLPLELF